MSQVSRLTLFFATAITSAAIIYSGCRQDEIVIDLAGSGYPEEVGKIILTKCAVTGCHNSQSEGGAAGLDLSTWEKLMEGDRNGAVCVPYAHDYSTLFIYTNVYSDLGVTGTPSMPLDREPLSREQVITLRNWIDAGAPNANGFVKFSDNPNRKKYYITNQGCDVVCVVDAETNLQMRYIPVGADAAIESPHNIRVSADGQYWYCCFIAGRYIEKHRASDDALVGRILLGSSSATAVGNWNTLALTPDGRYAMVVDWSPNGRIAIVDIENMRWVVTWQGSNYLVQPHGSIVQERNDTTFFIATANAGNYIYRLDTMDVFGVSIPEKTEIPIDGTSIAVNNNLVNVHDIVFSPDGSKYFVTCFASNTINVMDAMTDQFITSIPVGVYPQEVAISGDPSTPYLYVTCMEDTATYSGNRGSVWVINWQTNSVVTTINTGFQPHGIAVNDDRHQVLVANRNAFPGGPAPHHLSSCGGRNGYFTLIDMTTNTLVPGSKTELAVDPYSAVYR
jgi:YVTN family beta-propeller protein